MGNLHLVTGYAGRTHVTAADMGSLFEGLVRAGQFVMAAGSNFEANIVTNNSIRVKDGELLMQGRHVKLDPGAYVDLTIENGAQGLMRHDLIVARYTKNAETGIEDCSLVVIKGTAVEAGPVDPEHTTGDINAAGALQNDFPLYRVPISGLNVGDLEQLFTPQESLFDALLQRNAYIESNFVKKSNVDSQGNWNIDMEGHRILGLTFPKVSSEPANKNYVDNRTIVFKDPNNDGNIMLEYGGVVLEGEPVYVPVKGVDYYTEEDKDELIAEIINDIPFAEEVNV